MAAEPVGAVLKPDLCAKLTEQDVASGNDGTSSVLTPSISPSLDANSSIKGESGKDSNAEQGVYYPSTSCYDYYYPGYNGNFTQLDDPNYFNAGGGAYTGFQSDNGSLLYYLPGYNPYASGAFMGMEGQQPYYSSPGYLQHAVSYGSEGMPCYSWDSTFVGDVANGTSGISGKSKSANGLNTSMKSTSFNAIKSSNGFAGKFPTLPLDSKPRKSAATSNISKTVLESQPLKNLGKLGSGYPSGSLVKGFQPVGKFSPYINQNPGLFMHNYRSNGRVWNGNNRNKFRDRNGEFDASTELTRGPRAQNGSNPSNPSAEEHVGSTVQREKYNLEEFQTQYENAKFFVIKSYSEDDIHKCIKYDVWSSTPNGNKKLDDAFHEAEVKASETGTQCPVILFFSVNGSGQFVGVAEMIESVDFHKNMDFWQLDKWNGSFPVKWHIIKDIPNMHLRHIILENNDGRPVTYSRDTQEIGLKQGIEMLNIFKSYSERTSVLDDFNFYESREKVLKAKRSSKQTSSQTGIHEDMIIHKRAGERAAEEAARENGADPTSSIVNLTKNLSLNSHPLKSGAITNPSENLVPSVPAA
ncbi:unnamed protein product [Thlaspi arvense]|uniref:YTH domain-containing family protein n=1 Tax=Thlaspi arvense TaxID=13288 RepID=A0AAU9SMN2_THLAR|nr:unnamed protein product [Thlaspi arvense]